jgi:hypothetical protein
MTSTNNTNAANGANLNENSQCTELSAEDLQSVSGGLAFIFKLVAVKTVSWAYD